MRTVGSWGVGPFDSDDAGDMITNLMGSVRRVSGDERRSMPASYYYQEVLASHGNDILGGPDLKPAREALKVMLRDTKWIDGWRSPIKIRAQLEKELDQIERRLRAVKRRVPKFEKLYRAREVAAPRQARRQRSDPKLFQKLALR